MENQSNSKDPNRKPPSTPTTDTKEEPPEPATEMSDSNEGGSSSNPTNTAWPSVTRETVSNILGFNNDDWPAPNNHRPSKREKAILSTSRQTRMDADPTTSSNTDSDDRKAWNFKPFIEKAKENYNQKKTSKGKKSASTSVVKIDEDPPVVPVVTDDAAATTLAQEVEIEVDKPPSPSESTVIRSQRPEGSSSSSGTKDPLINEIPAEPLSLPSEVTTAIQEVEKQPSSESTRGISSSTIPDKTFTNSSSSSGIIKVEECFLSPSVQAQMPAVPTTPLIQLEKQQSNSESTTAPIQLESLPPANEWRVKPAEAQMAKSYTGLEGSSSSSSVCLQSQTDVPATPIQVEQSSESRGISSSQIPDNSSYTRSKGSSPSSSVCLQSQTDVPVTPIQVEQSSESRGISSSQIPDNSSYTRLEGPSSSSEMITTTNSTATPIQHQNDVERMQLKKLILEVQQELKELKELKASISEKIDMKLSIFNLLLRQLTDYLDDKSDFKEDNWNMMDDGIKPKSSLPKVHKIDEDNPKGREEVDAYVTEVLYGEGRTSTSRWKNRLPIFKEVCSENDEDKDEDKAK